MRGKSLTCREVGPDLVVYDRRKHRVEDRKMKGAPPASQRLAAHQHGQAIPLVLSDDIYAGLAELTRRQNQDPYPIISLA